MGYSTAAYYRDKSPCWNFFRQDEDTQCSDKEMREPHPTKKKNPEIVWSPDTVKLRSRGVWGSELEVWLIHLVLRSGSTVSTQWQNIERARPTAHSAAPNKLLFSNFIYNPASKLRVIPFRCFFHSSNYTAVTLISREGTTRNSISLPSHTSGRKILYSLWPLTKLKLYASFLLLLLYYLLLY